MRSQARYGLSVALAVILAIVLVRTGSAVFQGEAVAQGLASQPAPCDAAGWPSSVLSHMQMTRQAMNVPGTVTVGALGLLTPPDATTAIPVVWRMDANVLWTQRGSDGVIGVALADPSNGNQTLIAAFLSSACAAKADPALGQQVDAALASLYQICGIPSAVQQPCGAQVSVMGVGIFNLGATASGAAEAPNGLELRPVLGFHSGVSEAGAVAPGPPAAPSPPSVPAPAVVGAKNLSGIGAQDTLPFLLDPGAYTVTWSASAPRTDPVNFASFLKPVDPTMPGWIFVANAIVLPGQNQSGSVQSPTIAGGAYYLSVIGDGAWTLTITPAVASQSFAGAPPGPAPAGVLAPAPTVIPSFVAASPPPPALPPGVIVRNRPTPRPARARPTPIPRVIPGQVAP